MRREYLPMKSTDNESNNVNNNNNNQGEKKSASKGYIINYILCRKE